MNHRLKTWPEYFRAIRNREKTFEVRLNDRDFKVDDVLVLQEFDPCKTCGAKGRVITGDWGRNMATTLTIECPDCKGAGGKYTGLETLHRVTYILPAHQGIREGFVVMSLARAYLSFQERV
jgi:hypothetical protein